MDLKVHHVKVNPRILWKYLSMRPLHEAETGQLEVRETREKVENEVKIRRYQNASLSEVSSPSYWQQIHHFGSSVEGESLSEAGEGRFNILETDKTYGGNNEPEGEPRHNQSIVGRCRGGRNPPTYPALTEDEVSGERYPGHGVSLEIFSDKERMCRLLECLEARMAGCAVRGEQERYDALLSERDDLEELISVASDIRPGEDNPTS